MPLGTDVCYWMFKQKSTWFNVNKISICSRNNLLSSWRVTLTLLNVCTCSDPWLKLMEHRGDGFVRFG